MTIFGFFCLFLWKKNWEHDFSTFSVEFNESEWAEDDTNDIGEVIDVHVTCDQLDKEKRYIYLLCLLFLYN
jgi:hypothetical protein